MRALKVLLDGRSALSGHQWPLPDGDRPGEWVHASGPLQVCVNGIHACTISQLPQWLGDQLWRIELSGEIVEGDVAVVASRGRLLGPVTAWDLRTRVAFAEACADRVRGLAPAVPEGPTLLGAVERMGAAGRAGPAGYWASVIAGQAVAGRRSGPEYDNGFARERDAQANWLRDKLGPGT